jgi:hypothetical protein
MGLKNIQTLAAIASGTLNVNVDRSPASLVSLASITRINGSVTLTGNLNISPLGTALKNTTIKVLWEASVTITVGNQVVIFGETVPDELAAKNFVAECVYDGAAWVVNILPDFAGTGIIGSHRLASDSVTTTSIADDSVTLAKMAGLAKGNIIYGDASGDPAIVDLGAVDANLVVGDTTNGVAVVAMSGDATISKAGALTIATSAVTTAKIADDAVTSAKLDDDSNRTQVANIL